MDLQDLRALGAESKSPDVLYDRIFKSRVDWHQSSHSDSNDNLSALTLPFSERASPGVERFFALELNHDLGSGRDPGPEIGVLHDVAVKLHCEHCLFLFEASHGHSPCRNRLR